MFEAILANGGYPRRQRQDVAVALAHDAVQRKQRVILQAPTGVGKSFVAIAIAADAGRPGAPGIVATTMNSLGEQYLADCQRAAQLAQFSYTRVMGGRHYACADSEAGRSQGVPTLSDIEENEEGDGDNAAALRRHRDAWLNALVPDGTDTACQYELRVLARDESYACPGYPDCSGNQLGGCGSKAARARANHVAVVITNFHMLAYTHKLGIQLIPLANAAVVVVDEAHELAEKVAEIDGGKIDRTTGSKVFRSHPRVAAAITNLVTASLDRCVWGNSMWDTEAGVPVDMDGAAQLTREWAQLPALERERLTREKATDEGQFGTGDVVGLVDRFLSAANPAGTARAWTSRTRTGATWLPTRKIELRRVDAAAQVVPGMLPAAAVLMTGTAGETLPARLGLTDALVYDLGQEFDWTKVRGRVSRHSGVKSRIHPQTRQQRDAARIAELADAIRYHRGALVLTNAHDDAVMLGAELRRTLPGYLVFVQERGGGSIGAQRTTTEFIAHRDRGGFGVLIGTDSLATGLNLPGDLCTFVAWWVCVKASAGFYDEQVSGFYAAHGSYLDEKFRSRFAQGIGRLLRSHEDVGEVMVCDSRAWQHLQRQSRVDAHLGSINWNGAA